MLFWNGKRKFKIVCDYCLKEYDTIGDPRNEYNKNYLKIHRKRVKGKLLSQVCCKPVIPYSKVEISSVHRLKWYMKKYQLLDEGWKIVEHELKINYPGLNYSSSTTDI